MKAIIAFAALTLVATPVRAAIDPSDLYASRLALASKALYGAAEATNSGRDALKADDIRAACRHIAQAYSHYSEARHLFTTGIDELSQERAASAEEQRSSA